MYKKLFLTGTILVLAIFIYKWIMNKPKSETGILSYTVNTKKQNLLFFWKNDKGEFLKNIENLDSYAKGKNLQLQFAMNAGMYQADLNPLGLYVENGKGISPLNKKKLSPDKGNFYIQPNGVFGLDTDNMPFICKTENYESINNVKYATQSGPLLIIDGMINSAFGKNSTNINIRNGVGILPDNKLLFAISQHELNFYDFANFFLRQGCKNALYLDGYVSQALFPENKRINQCGPLEKIYNCKKCGGFGVMIGVVKKND